MANKPRRYDNLADFDFESLIPPQEVSNQPVQNNELTDDELLALNQGAEDPNADYSNTSVAGVRLSDPKANQSFSSKANDAGERYLSQKKAERTTTAEILKKAQDALLARSQEGWNRGDYFRLAAALGKPTRFGTFGEELGNAAEVMASVSDRQTKAKQDYEALKLKYELQNAAQPAEDAEQEFNVYTKLATGRGQGASRLRQMQMERDALPMNDPARAELSAAIELMTTEKKTKANSPSGQFVDLVNIANDSSQPKEVREAAAAKIRKDTYIPPQKAPRGEPPPVVNLTAAESTGVRLGVPVLIDTPFANVDQKTQQQLVLQASKRAQAEIAKVEEAADKAQFSQQKMARFLKLNKENPTNPITGKLPSFKASAQEMDNITAELAPEKRLEGTGSVSDFDAKQLLKAVVNPSNSYEANKNIGLAWDAYAKTVKEKSNFLRNYFTANKTLDGANQQWMRYMNANPIFDPKQPGTFVPNKNRKTYKEFFYPPKPQQKAEGGIVNYSDGGQASQYNNYYEQNQPDLSVLMDKYAKGGSVKHPQYDQYGRQKLGWGGTVTAYAEADPNWKYDPNNPPKIGLFGSLIPIPIAQQLVEKAEEKKKEEAANKAVVIESLNRKYNPFTGNPYDYGSMSEHNFYGDPSENNQQFLNSQYEIIPTRNVDTTYKNTDFINYLEAMNNASDEGTSPETYKILSQDELLDLNSPMFAEGGEVSASKKHTPFTGNPYEYGYRGEHLFFADDLSNSENNSSNSNDIGSGTVTTTPMVLNEIINTTPTLEPTSNAGISIPLVNKWKKSFKLGKGLIPTPTPTSDAGTSVPLNSKLRNNFKWLKRPIQTPTPAPPPPAPVSTGKLSMKKWLKKQEGGVVRMQEGGVPPESVVRLKPIRSSDSANRARAFFGQGMGMSIGDEAEALYRKYLTDEGTNKSYGQLVDEIRSDYRRFSEENPEQQMAFELSGGIAPTVGAMLLPGGQTAAGANAGRMANMFTKTPLRRAVTGAGASGAVSGFNAGEDTLSNRLGSATESGLTSAVLGPVVGKAGQLALRGGKGAVNLAKRPFQIGDNYLEQQAMDKVLEKMRQDGITPRQAVGRIASDRGYNPTTRPVGTRPDTRLMDVSQGLTDLAETVTQRPGGGRTAMVEDMKNRVRGTKGRVTQMANEALAGNKAYFKEVTDLTKDLRSKADTAYQAAYAHGDVSDPRIMGILDTPEFKRAYQEIMKTNQIKKANAVARGEDPSMFDMKQIYRVKPGQNPDSPILDLELTDVPDVRTLDNIKQGIDTVIAKGFASDDKISRDAANALKQLKNTYVSIIDDAVPAYKVARNQYKGDIEIIEALETGRNQYSKMLPDEAMQYVSTLSDAEKQALRVGYAQNFATKIGESKNSINAAEQIIGAENERLRLRALFSSDAEYKVFENALMAESRNFKNAGQVVANSATERRAMGRKEFENNDAVGEILDATRGGVTSTVLSILRKAPSLFKNEKIAEKVSKILSTGTPKEINSILKQMEKRAVGFSKSAKTKERVGYAGAKGTGRASGQTPVAASYEEPAPEELPSAIDPSSEGALDPSESVIFDSPEMEQQDMEEPEQIEMPMEQQRYGGGLVRKFDRGGYAELTEKEIADHARMVEYQKLRRRQADEYLKQVYDMRARRQSRSPIGGVGGGVAVGHMADPSAVKSLIPNFKNGGAVNQKALRGVMKKMRG